MASSNACKEQRQQYCGASQIFGIELTRNAEKMHTYHNTTQMGPQHSETRLDCTKIASQTVKCAVLGSSHGDGTPLPL